MPWRIIDDTYFHDHHNLSAVLDVQPWHLETNVANAHNGTITKCDGLNETRKYTQSLSLYFAGTEFVLVGRPTTDLKISYLVSGRKEYVPVLMNTGSDVVGKDGVMICTVKNIQERQPRTIHLYPYGGALFLDFVLYFQPEDYPDEGYSYPFLIGDRDSAMAFTGEWTVHYSWKGLSTGPETSTVALNNTMRGSSSAGASFTTNFTGTAFTVYGMLNSVPGKLVVSYSINQSEPVTITHFDGTQNVDTMHWTSGKLFEKALPPGLHFLTVKLEEVTESQSYYLDYITYDQSPTRGGLPPPEPTRENDQQEDKTQALSTGKLIAIITSLIVFAAIVVCSGVYYRRSKQKSVSAKKSDELHTTSEKRSTPSAGSDGSGKEPFANHPLQQDGSYTLHPSQQDGAAIVHPAQQDGAAIPHPWQQDGAIIPPEHDLLFHPRSAKAAVPVHNEKPSATCIPSTLPGVTRNDTDRDDLHRPQPGHPGYQPRREPTSPTGYSNGSASHPSHGPQAPSSRQNDDAMTRRRLLQLQIGRTSLN